MEHTPLPPPRFRVFDLKHTRIKSWVGWVQHCVQYSSSVPLVMWFDFPVVSLEAEMFKIPLAPMLKVASIQGTLWG